MGLFAWLRKKPTEPKEPLRSEVDFKLMFDHRGEVAQCRQCGKIAIPVYGYCPVCGCAVKQDGLFCDPIEWTPEYREAMTVIGPILEKRFPESERKRGDCHGIWGEKKALLLKKYNIEWLSPSQMNPFCMFD